MQEQDKQDKPTSTSHVMCCAYPEMRCLEPSIIYGDISDLNLDAIVFNKTLCSKHPGHSLNNVNDTKIWETGTNIMKFQYIQVLMHLSGSYFNYWL